MIILSYLMPNLVLSGATLPQDISYKVIKASKWAINKIKECWYE